MKSSPFIVRRTPVKPSLFRKLRANTRSKRQKVSAAPAYDDDYEDDDDGGSKIGRSLVIIFLFHIVLLGLIFVHYRYLRNRTPDAPATQVATQAAATTPPAPIQRGETTHLVLAGEDYPQIASTHGVLEADLRALNQNLVPQKGMLLRVPAPRPVVPVAAAPAAPAAPPTPIAPSQAQPVSVAPPAPIPSQQALVPAVDVSHAPRAQAVTTQTQSSQTSSSATSYVVRPGDSIIVIAKRHKVQPEALIKANRITDPKKIRPGMKLTIPAP